MKKKVLGMIAVAAVAAASWNYQQKESVQLSDLMLENTEALAKSEIDVGRPCIIAPITCYEINDNFGHTIVSGYK